LYVTSECLLRTSLSGTSNLALLNVEGLAALLAHLHCTHIHVRHRRTHAYETQWAGVHNLTEVKGMCLDSRSNSISSNSSAGRVDRSHVAKTTLVRMSRMPK
jgi:phosphoglycerate-specific signal transduction histidine kinase